MFHIFGILLIILIAILFIGLSIVGTVIRSIFGLGKRRSSGTYQGGNTSRPFGGGYTFNGKQQQSASARSEQTTAGEGDEQQKHKKLFTKDDGEYVDFEEIKE